MFASASLHASANPRVASSSALGPVHARLLQAVAAVDVKGVERALALRGLPPGPSGAQPGSLGRMVAEKGYRNGGGEVLLALMKHGYDVEPRDELGDGLEHLALRFGAWEVAIVMSRSKLGLSRLGSSGSTCLMAACQNPIISLELAAFLIDAGSALEARDHSGQTALFKAAQEGNDAMALALLDLGADPLARDGAGLSVAGSAHPHLRSGPACLAITARAGLIQERAALLAATEARSAPAPGPKKYRAL